MISDISEIMRFNEDFAKKVLDKNSDFWKKDNKKIISEIFKQSQPFYLIYQVEYYKVGDDYSTAKPYYYSVKYKVEKKESLDGFEISFFKSRSGNTEREGKFFTRNVDNSIIMINN